MTLQPNHAPRGASIFCEEQGAGNVIVLLHGFSLDSRMWDSEFEYLSDAHRVIRYDLRGFGRSANPGDSWGGHVDDLVELLDTLGVQTATFLGLSLGGNVALATALAHPDRCSALILGSSGLPGHQSREQRPPEETMEVARKQGPEAARDFWLSHKLFESAIQSPDAAARLRRMVLDYSGWHWANPDLQRPLPVCANRLDHVDAPALVLSGALDMPLYREAAQVMARGLRSAEHIEIPAVGHMMNMEAPVAFQDLVLRFLQRHNL